MNESDEQVIQENEVSNSEENNEEIQDHELPKNWRYAYSHPKDLIIGDTS